MSLHKSLETTTTARSYRNITEVTELTKKALMVLKAILVCASKHSWLTYVCFIGKWIL
jgi:hypothetical protein